MAPTKKDATMLCVECSVASLAFGWWQEHFGAGLWMFLVLTWLTQLALSHFAYRRGNADRDSQTVG
jgi:hypothetical protein